MALLTHSPGKDPVLPLRPLLWGGGEYLLRKGAPFHVCGGPCKTNRLGLCLTIRRCRLGALGWVFSRARSPSASAVT